MAKQFKVNVVYSYYNIRNTYVDSIYLLDHSARARKAKIVASGKKSFIVKRTLRGKGTLIFAPPGTELPDGLVPAK